MRNAAIIGGTLAVSAMLKTHEISGAALRPPVRHPRHRRLAREWGFLLLAIPGSWALATAAAERRGSDWSKRWTILSGSRCCSLPS
ncbi:MAG: hypothetical protein R3F11_00705 [Verrucomicrobiales bacterium]